MIVDASRCRSVPPGMALGLRTLRQGYRACPMLRPWTRVRSLGPSAEDDMYSWAEQLAARRRKYEAMGYQTQFRMNYNGSAQSEVVTGLVAGAQLTWADDSSLGLQRRAILSFSQGHPSTVLIVKKIDDEEASTKLRELAGWLQQQGLRVVVEKEVATSDSLRYDTFSQAIAPSIDLCITLGGDGTVLHLASLFVDGGPMPPVISFAMGSLGFLTPFTARVAQKVLSRLLWPPQHADPIFCTLRTRKACEMYVGGHPTRTHRVLNECLVDRGASPAMVVMECFVDGVHLTTVQADGLIIATPSGSTAYSMSAGGPMVAPSVPCTLLTPVAPHSLSFRPIIVPEHSVIEVHLPRSSRAAARASFDGRHPTVMHPDSSIVCRTSRFALPMISMHPLDEDWYEGITQKLRWTGSLRNDGARPLKRPRDAADLPPCSGVSPIPRIADDNTEP